MVQVYVYGIYSSILTYMVGRVVVLKDWQLVRLEVEEHMDEGHNSRWCVKHGRMVASLGRRARAVLFWKHARLRRVVWLGMRVKQMLWLQDAGSWLRARDGGRET